MTTFLKEATAVSVVLGPFIDDTDGKTPKTGLTIAQADVLLSKNAGSTAQKNSSTSASHLSGGHYAVPLSTTDTNTLGRLRIYVNKSTALPLWADYMVVAAQVWDSLFGSDRLQVHAAEISNDLITNAALATSAVGEIADAVWDEPSEDHLTNSPYLSAGWLLYGAASTDTDGIADAVWDAATADHGTAGTTGKALSDLSAGSSPEAIADAVWDEATSGHATPGTTGAALAAANAGDYIGGSSTAATNAKNFFTSTGYNASASTVGTATNVTNYVLADLRRIAGSAAGAYAAFAQLLAGTVPATVVSGTNTTTVISTGLATTTTGFYVGKTLFVTSGSLAGQGGRVVTAYDGATKRLTVTPALTAALSAGDTIALVG